MQATYGSSLSSVAQRITSASGPLAVPEGSCAVVVRADGRVTVAAAGERVRRGWGEPPPEIYLVADAGHFLPLWLTGLTSADGKAVNLGWRVQVRAADPVQLWRAWLQHQEIDGIPLPADQVSARLADPAHDLVQRYTMGDLRADTEVRRHVGGKLSLLLRETLKEYGLEIAEQFDVQALRFQTDADLAAAEQERAVLRRMQADAQLQAALDEMENTEVVAYRLREWLAERKSELDDELIAHVAARVVAGDASPAMALAQEQARVASEVKATPAAVTLLPIAGPQGRWHVARRLGQFVAVATLLVVLLLTLIAFLRPELLATDGDRTQTVLGIAALAVTGLVVAWVFDQVMRWEAHREAQAMLTEAQVEQDALRDGRVQLRHILMLLGALLGLTAAAIAIWLPQYYEVLRIGGAVVGLLGAAYAIRADYLHNVDQSRRAISHAQRRIASSQLSGAQRVRNHARFQIGLSTELEIVRQRLDETASLAYSNLSDRAMSRQVRTLEDKVKLLLPQAKHLDLSLDERTGEEWDRIDESVGQMQSSIQRSSELATWLQTAIQQKQRPDAEAHFAELEQIVRKLESELMRWKAVVA